MTLKAPSTHTNIAAPKNNNKNHHQTELLADVIVGGYLGDEGKGKYVGGVCQQYDAVFRVNASTNAGHCVNDGVNTYITRQLPSVFYPKKTELVIAPGALLNLTALETEVLERPDLPSLLSKIKVASSVSLVIEPYIMKDMGDLGSKLGSTHQGTGPSAAARAARHSLHLYDIQAAAEESEAYDKVLEKIRTTCRETLPMRFDKNTFETKLYYRELLDKLIRSYKSIKNNIGEFCIDYSEYLHKTLRCGSKTILIEGCNGLLLDNLHGAHPYVTSSSTNIGALICGANIAPANVRNIIVVASAYATCLGIRPFPTEIDENGAVHFFENCNEIDVAEFKKRRIGWLDIPGLRKALLSCHNAHIHMNKLDVLTGLKKIKICTEYQANGVSYSVLPDNPFIHPQLKPHYIELNGWNESLANVRRFEDLPKNAQIYIEAIEDLLPNPILSIGVGPRNQDLIFRT